jgi:hypothetical protein
MEQVNKGAMLLILLMMGMKDVTADSYYVSQAGDDSNGGTTDKTAWRTLEKVNTAKLKAGDQMYFHRGDVFRGQLEIRGSGKPGEPIVIAAYGVGAKPILSGAVLVKLWKSYKNGIYQASQTNAVTSVYVNDNLQSLARYPSAGFCTIEHGDKISMDDSHGLPANVDLIGATVRIRAVDWQYEIAKVVSHQSNKIVFAQNMMYECGAGYGYFLDNKLEFLDNPGEWFYDSKKGLLYLKTSDRIDPASAKTEASIYSYGIAIDPAASFIEIRDLQLEKYETAGIAGMKDSSWVFIHDCTFRDVDVYGIMLDLNSGHYVVKGNRIEDVRGRGISTIESSDNEISDNIIRRIGLCPGYGFNGVNNAIGIAVLKTEVMFSISERVVDQLKLELVPSDVVGRIVRMLDLPYPDEKFLVTALAEKLGGLDANRYTPLIVKHIKEEMGKQKLESRNNLVACNVIEDTGYAGIRLDGQNSIVERNIIKNTMLHMSDGGALYCWGQNTNYTFNNIFRNNIISNAVGNSEATPHKAPFVCGIYIDNKSHHINIESNVVIKTGMGILLNDESHHHRIVGNTSYDNQYGLVFNEYFMPGTLGGCEAYGNVLFSRQSDQRALLVQSHLREGFRPVALDGNIYAGCGELPAIVEKTSKDGVEHKQEFSLQQWREHYGQDAQSKAIRTDHDSVIFVNEGKAPGNFKIPTDAEYCNLQGQSLAGEISLPQFSSQILIRKEPHLTP